MFLYAASFTSHGNSAGLYVFDWPGGRTLRAGRGLPPAETTAHELENPLAITADPGGRFLFVADCTNAWQNGGALFSYAINRRNGRLSLINTVESAGVIPVHLSVSADGRTLLVANSGPFSPDHRGRTIAAIRVHKNGRLSDPHTVQSRRGASIDPERQSSAHPHGVVLNPQQDRVFVPDLGRDVVDSYAFDPALGALRADNQPAVTVPGGHGPRDLKFHPRGKYAYLLTEMGDRVHCYQYIDGQLLLLQDATIVPEGTSDRRGAELQIRPDGRYLYTTSRALGLITVFAVDDDSGKLTRVENRRATGVYPRSIAIHPNGRSLLVGNQQSNTIEGFRLRRKSGRLKRLGVLAELPGPVALTFVQTRLRGD